MPASTPVFPRADRSPDPGHRLRRALAPSAPCFSAPATSIIVVTTSSSHGRKARCRSPSSPSVTPTYSSTNAFSCTSLKAETPSKAEIGISGLYRTGSQPQSTITKLRAYLEVPPSPRPHAHLHLSALRPSTQDIAAAHAAIVANISSALDPKLQDYAHQLHAGHAAIASQRDKVEHATTALGRENKMLGRLIGEAERMVKELGSLRNWAEVLEQDMLVLECTMKIVRGDDDD
ncbi:hypothetical protein BROUX41_001080 [Berkeleyomyces rouxiae]